MTALQERRTRLTFETADSVRSRGAYRAVVIEAEPRTCIIRLKGTRKRYSVSWAAVHDFAAKQEADALRREKAAAKKAPAKRGAR